MFTTMIVDEPDHYFDRRSSSANEVRLIPPADVKPFVRRQKNDAADAEAICEAAQRPNMGFVPGKSEEKQGPAAVFRVRELPDDQRAPGPSDRARRGCPAAASMRRLIGLLEEPDGDLPETARATLQVLVDSLRHLDERIAGLDEEIARRAREGEVARRLMTIPGIGPLIATALATLAPPPEHFRKARDFAAWLG